ncbi:copper homeostasis protein CutC [Mesoplasma photuris]|uniref:copper homeostasis protein CutC n=1 Tax=Mesoplasma photuris TaxID=217731 RepID=UPI0004E12FFE|nr:copper homeostasis protein CutC [Mesoplasma photuris]
MKLEVIAADIKDIELINKTNADRIEFCADLQTGGGGLTPTYEDIKKAGEISKLPVNVMLRPTDRDFYYTEEEFQLMLKDCEYMATTKINAIVVGIITPEGEINMERMKKIMEKAGNKKVTFHKAFDEVKDLKKALKDLEKLGVDTVLTSGGGNINEKIEVLKELKGYTNVTILAGGGVSFENINKVKDVVDQVHVGTCVRQNSNWFGEVNVDQVNKMKALVK